MKLSLKCHTNICYRIISWYQILLQTVAIYEDFGARSRYLRQGWVIASHSTSWDAIINLCLRYLLLAPKSSYMKWKISGSSTYYNLRKIICKAFLARKCGCILSLVEDGVEIINNISRVQLTSNEIPRLHITWPFVREIHQQLTYSPQWEPIIWRVSSCPQTGFRCDEI